jgi:hypothetical protein
VRGQIVTLPPNFCKKTDDQSCPNIVGINSRSRMTLKFLVSSSLRYCSMALSTKPVRLVPVRFCTNLHANPCPFDVPRAFLLHLWERKRTLPISNRYCQVLTMHVRVDLRNDRVVDVEKQVKRLQGDVDTANQMLSTTKRVTHRRLPSLNLEPQFIGLMDPSLFFCIKTTELRMPGTAADATARSEMSVTSLSYALIADHMTQSGLVR